MVTSMQVTISENDLCCGKARIAVSAGLEKVNGMKKNFCFSFKMTGSLAKQQSKKGRYPVYPGEKKPLLQQLPARDENILTFSDQNECEKQ